VPSQVRAQTKEIENDNPVASSQTVDEYQGNEARWQIVALLRPVWLRRRTVFRMCLYTMLVTLLIVLLIPSQYESTAQLMPPSNPGVGNLAMLSSVVSGTSGDLGGTAASMASDVLGFKSSGSLFVGVLESRTIQDGVINRINLRKVYWVSTYYKARKILSDRTSIKEDRKSGIVTIAVWDTDPRRAAAIARAYVEQLNQVLAHSSTSSARRERIFLDGRLQEIKQQLDDAQKRFSEFASQKGAIDVKEQGRAMVEAAATLEGQLIAAQSEASGLEQIYTTNNVRVRSLIARIDELKRKLAQIGGSEGSALGADGSENSSYPSIRQLPILGVTWLDLYRQTRISETVYEILTKQYEMAKVQEAKELPVAQVFDEPTIAEKKSFPPRFLFTLAGGILGMLFGAVYIVGQEAWAQRDPRDPLKMFLTEMSGDIRFTWQRSSMGKRVSRIAAYLRRRRLSPDDALNGDRH
jgi:uncharacterized protein involved in exopolysaccharide biosynthesis